MMRSSTMASSSSVSTTGRTSSSQTEVNDQRTAGALPVVAALVVVALVAVGSILASPWSTTAGTRTGPRQPLAHAVGPVEGADYSVMAVVDGVPVRWRCDHEIPVRLVGPAPDAAGRLLKQVVRQVIRASGLPLVYAAHNLAWSDSVFLEGELTVRYVDPDVRQAPGLAFQDDDAVGRGGPTWGNDGVITAGHVAIRTDEPFTGDTSPASSYGRSVLLHELIHAVGGDHAADDTGSVMAPGSGAVRFNKADRYLLRLLGCPRNGRR